MQAKSVCKIFVLWLVYAIKYEKRIINPYRVELKGRLIARWYSPIFWGYCLLMLIYYVFFGGLISWVMFVVEQIHAPTFSVYFGRKWDTPVKLSWTEVKRCEMVAMYLDAGFSDKYGFPKQWIK